MIFKWIKRVFNSAIRKAWRFIKVVFPPATQIVISELKNFALRIINNLDYSDLENEEKRKQAFEMIKKEAKSRGIKIRESLINLLIEMCVAYLKGRK